MTAPKTKRRAASQQPRVSAVTPEAICRTVRRGRYTHSLQAERQRQEGSITVAELEAALDDCAIIEQYHNAHGVSCLVLGFAGARPIHILCAMTDRPREIVLLGVV